MFQIGFQSQMISWTQSTIICLFRSQFGQLMCTQHLKSHNTKKTQQFWEENANTEIQTISMLPDSSFRLKWSAMYAV